MDLEVIPYFNPWLPGNRGWMACDDDGNYGFGRTPLDAIVDYLNQFMER